MIPLQSNATPSCTKCLLAPANVEAMRRCCLKLTIPYCCCCSAFIIAIRLHNQPIQMRVVASVFVTCRKPPISRQGLLSNHKISFLDGPSPSFSTQPQAALGPRRGSQWGKSAFLLPTVSLWGHTKTLPDSLSPHGGKQPNVPERYSFAVGLGEGVQGDLACSFCSKSAMRAQC